MELSIENPFAPSEQTRARAAQLAPRFAPPAPSASPGELRTAVGLSVVVVGAGRSGLAAARVAARRGANVTVVDDRAPELVAPAIADVPGARAARLEAAALEGADLVVLSPGVPRRRPELQAAIRRGVVVGELELGAWATRRPMVAITGTNGKSTTTALTAHLLTRGGRRVFAGGNLGRPLCELALDGADVDVAVVEVSSYQLESIVEAHFDVACWLNLTPDHLDRYDDVGAYALAKRRVLEQRSLDGVAVLNAHDPLLARLGDALGGSLRWFAAGERAPRAVAEGTFAAVDGPAVRTGRGVRVEERYVLDNPRLVGLHNRANMAAAIECARLAGAAIDGVQAGLADFAGLPHRIELVGERDGVRWYNDSKATNVDSAVTAARAVAGPKILIAGGKDKGAPWAPLVDALRGQLRAVLAIGEATPIVTAAFAGAAPIVESVGTLGAAVERAGALAQAGDAVLLAPACASFDQFKSYEDRGDQFRAMVRARTAGATSEVTR